MSKPQSTQQDNIPTLTELVKGVPDETQREHLDSENSEIAETESDIEPIIEDGNINRIELEKLIYKKLHQQLPDICRSLAEDILATLEPNKKTESVKKSNRRRRP